MTAIAVVEAQQYERRKQETGRLFD